MKHFTNLKKIVSLILVTVILASFAACGGKKNQNILKDVYDALLSEDSSYMKNTKLYREYYPELGYDVKLGEDRITISFKANGNEYFKDGSWDFILDGGYLSIVIGEDDLSGYVYVMQVADAIAMALGMDRDLAIGYLNGVGVLDIESDVFIMTEDEEAKTTTVKLSVSSPWKMKELDSMVINEKVIDDEPLDDSSVSQAVNIGKISMKADGSVSHYTALFAEYGKLDQLVYDSILNVVKVRKPAGWENFVSDFTSLKDLEKEGYKVVLNPDDEIVEEMMEERGKNYKYVLVEFGSDDYTEEDQ